jgi:hypothetical protein
MRWFSAEAHRMRRPSFASNAPEMKTNIATSANISRRSILPDPSGRPKKSEGSAAIVDLLAIGD